MEIRAEDTIEIKVLDILEDSVEKLGYEIVRVKLIGNIDMQSLQIMIDKKDGAIIDVNDCEEVSKHVSAILDIEDLMSNAYNLEISSPGIDRPLTRIKDFKRFIGFDLKLETKNKIDGQGKFRGKLNNANETEILLDLNIRDLTSPDKLKQVTIDFDNIKNAKLVLTDELLEFSKQNNN